MHGFDIALSSEPALMCVELYLLNSVDPAQSVRL
jgi:hypothetical protein